jgi:hypothetical protein
MLAYDPSRRMSAKAALKSEYFDGGAYDTATWFGRVRTNE